VRIGDQLAIVNTLEPPTNGLILWWDADDASTLTIRTDSGKDYVTRWDSKVGTQYVEQVVAADQPQWTNGFGFNGRYGIWNPDNDGSERLQTPGPIPELNSTNLNACIFAWCFDTNDNASYIMDNTWLTNAPDTTYTDNTFSIYMHRVSDRGRWRFKSSGVPDFSKFENVDFYRPTNNIPFGCHIGWETNHAELAVSYKGITCFESTGNVSSWQRKNHHRLTLLNRDPIHSNRPFAGGILFEILIYNRGFTNEDKQRLWRYGALKWQLRQWKPNRKDPISNL